MRLKRHWAKAIVEVLGNDYRAISRKKISPSKKKAKLNYIDGLIGRVEKSVRNV